MSGFGSSFGSPAPGGPASGPSLFGASSSTPNNSATAGHTQSNNTGFGASTSPPAFGAPVSFAPAVAFAAPAPALAAPLFGSPTSVFGSSNGPAQGFAMSTGFGSSASPAPFGSPISALPFGSVQKPSAATTVFASGGFGTGNSSAAFGPISSPAPSAFGSNQNTASMYGSAGSANLSFGPTSITNFGSASSNPFGGPPRQAPSSDAYNSLSATPFATSSMSTPFGSTAPTQSTGTPFGSSTNAMVNPFTSISTTAPNGSTAPTQSTVTPFGSSTNAMVNPFTSISTTAPAVSMSFGASTNLACNNDLEMESSSPTPHGMSPIMGSPIHSASDSEDMADAGGGNNASAFSSSNAPFGKPIFSSTTKSGWPAPAPFGGGALGTIPESASTFPPSMMTSAGEVAPSSVYTESADSLTSNADDNRLAELKARIEEKKRVLLEKKKREAETSSTTTALNADAPSFVPESTSTNVQSALSKKAILSLSEDRSPAPRSRSTSPIPPINISSLSDRNALRFTGSHNGRSHMPADLQSKSEETPNYAALRTDPQGGRADLGSAVSMVGTCPYMCPDEELLRREREGDIQLLETPQPGTLHPESWTYRDTVVKRFRRSAADYKLDVPEWVRPPDVLERVCSYLEEWIMEKDRQGPDPRFPQGGVPPSLDVYQFIWDRTRMIRKDFILQNYVGTGGACDARAVRCHERIARWHAMCEHQLSHISEYVSHQSQQNIQELGQTMKTLNQYYDDSLKRSLIEVPDAQGNETRLNLLGQAHGCESNSVQGPNPVDYDGTPLSNDEDTSRVSLRVIGGDLSRSSMHGTAEPEMRGLYILLTIDNDGGMEVLKYAAWLFRERPYIYQSQPVQLAMTIYKAKREFSYARFFSILRSSSTPYLFACIMFKHVQVMRKNAFQIMSKTFGVRSSATEAIYDAYPLRDLMRLLCFEDIEEARNACQHYNITCKEMKIKTSASGTRIEDIVFWRATKFRVPTDAEKGTIVQLRPKKMIKTIESKLNGATRLAVCRGEVSAFGASPTDREFPLVSAQSQNVALKEDTVKRNSGEEVALLVARKQEIERQQQEELEKRQQIERRRLDEERIRHAAEKEQRISLELKRQDMESKQREIELRQQQAKERIELERLQKEEVEQQRKLEEEAERKARDEEVRRQLELERLEKTRREELKRLDEEARKREEFEKQRLQREAEEAEARRQEEAARQKKLALEKEKERQQCEEKARLNDVRWREQIEEAKKILLWKRWKQKLPKYLENSEETARMLQHLSPTSSASLKLVKLLHGATTFQSHQPASPLRHKFSYPPDLRMVLENLLNQDTKQINLSSGIAESLSRIWRCSRLDNSCQKCFLFKIGVLCPQSKSIRLHSLSELLKAWLQTVLSFHKIHETSTTFVNVRVVVVDSNHSKMDDCDCVLVVVPVMFSIGEELLRLKGLSSTIGRTVPRVVLGLTDNFDRACVDDMNRRLDDTFSSLSNNITLVNNAELSLEDVRGALHCACEQIAQRITEEAPVVIQRMTPEQVACKCISDAISQSGPTEKRDKIVELAQAALIIMIEEMEDVATERERAPSWPASEFANDSGRVLHYFGRGEHLPLLWSSTLSRGNVESRLTPMSTVLNGSLPDALEQLLRGAPEQILYECHTLLDKRLFRQCLQQSLFWFRDAIHSCTSESFLYFAPGDVDCIAQATGIRLRNLVERENSICFEANEGKDDVRENDLFAEVIDSPLEFDGEAQLALGSATETPTPPESPEVTKTTPKRALSDASIQPIDSVEAGSFAKQTPGAVPTPQSLSYGTSPKRARQTSVATTSLVAVSSDVMHSRKWTERLEALASGDVMADMIVGQYMLSALVQDAPPLTKE